MLHKVLKHAKQCCIPYTCVVKNGTNTFIGMININLSSVERGKRKNGIGLSIIRGFKCICCYSFKIIS